MRCLIQVCITVALLCNWAVLAEAQLTFITNTDNTITITGYTGSDNEILIPDRLNGFPVVYVESWAFAYHTNLTGVIMSTNIVSIGSSAFQNCSNLTSISIPAKVENIGPVAFGNCSGLTSVELPDSVTYIGQSAFSGCSGLTNVVLPNNLALVGYTVFAGCSNLTRVIIPRSVTKMLFAAFGFCANLKEVCFCGNAPDGGGAFFNSPRVNVYYLPGTIGWDTIFAGYPAMHWYLPYPTILYFEPDYGVQASGFGFTVSWATNTSVLVEAKTNLSSLDWQPVQTNTLSDGSAYFSDSQWTNYPSRFYRVRSL